MNLEKYGDIIHDEFDRMMVNALLSGIDENFNNLILKKCAICGGLIMGSKLYPEELDETPRLTNGEYICDGCIKGYSTTEEADNIDAVLIKNNEPRYLDEDCTLPVSDRKPTWDEAIRCEKKCKKIIAEAIKIGNIDVYTKYKHILED